ncbi:FCD domain-containing protein [Nocardioides sp. TF02-7]|uniref:FadR/GntR family transcriptional regulator n=1 Tax=Nocardioides sp. TF02-7 TaxID=2917724 RepID=UPI001F058E86|nr:FCD domain-containing protein [Nocardioides sp. TF02-7]UMG93721.1 FCD domain-containing protein [Nocardioides sp. TF02-7]
MRDTDMTSGTARSAASDVLARFAVEPSAKRAEHVAAAIASDIVRSGWPVGETLGTEPDLLRQYAVSRSVFRQAVGLLEHHGVAAMRQGPSGGLVVTAPDGGSFRRAAMLYLDYQQVSAADLFETRIAIESLAIDLAGRHLDEAGIRKLRRSVTEDRDPERASDQAAGHPHGHTLHLVVADLSGNPAIRLFVDILLSLTERQFGPDEVTDAADRWGGLPARARRDRRGAGRGRHRAGPLPHGAAPEGDRGVPAALRVSG